VIASQPDRLRPHLGVPRFDRDDLSVFAFGDQGGHRRDVRGNGSGVKTPKIIAESAFINDENGGRHTDWRLHTRFDADRHVPTRIEASPAYTALAITSDEIRWRVKRPLVDEPYGKTGDVTNGHKIMENLTMHGWKTLVGSPINPQW
jgi:hypothetical protein